MGYLPVLDVLRVRGMCLNYMLLVCNQEQETVCHALTSCSKVSIYFVNNNLDVNASDTLSSRFLLHKSFLSKQGEG